MERGGGDGGWSAARAGRRRRRRRRGSGGAAGREEAAEEELGRLQEARAALLGSGFWACARGVVARSLPEVAAGRELRVCPPGPPPWRCVCYGLGSFSSCAKARGQLALLLLLLDELQIPRELCCLFDPAFSAPERELLGTLGLSVLSQNEEGKRPIGEPTVFYMIHCGKALYNNLLWSNWSAEALSKMLIIGNSFKATEERLPARIFQTDYAYIAKVLAACEEEALPAHAHYLDVFNDTAVHRFPWHKLRELPQETWDFRQEPVYRSEDLLEIIRDGDVT